MEKKNVSTKKTKSTNKKTSPVKKTSTKKKSKKAFTLIELLAVIIILGILMIIAVPAVTSYISNSRKSAYINTAKAVMDGARTKVNAGMGLYNTDTTYYIPASIIKTETGDAKSPYGEFEKAYVVVTYNGTSYDYYWMSVDTTRTGVKFAKYDDLDEDDIESDLELDDINTTVGIDGRSKVVVFDENGVKGPELSALNQYDSNSGEISDIPTKICITRDSLIIDGGGYYNYTGNPTLQELLDNHIIELEMGEYFHAFYPNSYYTCVANNPYTVSNQYQQYVNYLHSCESGMIKNIDVSTIAKDSTQGCYLVGFPR